MGYTVASFKKLEEKIGEEIQHYLDLNGLTRETLTGNRKVQISLLDATIPQLKQEFEEFKNNKPSGDSDEKHERAVRDKSIQNAQILSGFLIIIMNEIKDEYKGGILSLFTNPAGSDLHEGVKKTLRIRETNELDPCSAASLVRLAMKFFTQHTYVDGMPSKPLLDTFYISHIEGFDFTKFWERSIDYAATYEKKVGRDRFAEKTQRQKEEAKAVEQKRKESAPPAAGWTKSLTSIFGSGSSSKAKKETTDEELLDEENVASTSEGPG